ncbi:ATP-binding protein [Agrobacterium tumefaciens]|uniref:ATP-binding protein n=1 Tax=Agrobacterium tumefaciens TaxID=358 RepID=UPI0015719925|nr:ATP-binding protein [Agrobacterium tumefaciens]
MERLSTLIGDLERRFGVLEKKRAECEVHGTYVSSLIERTGNWTGCADCSREKQAQEEQLEQERERERRASLRVTQLLGRSAIPEKFAQKSLADYRAETQGQRQAVEACRDYAETFPERLEDGRCLLLLGNPGTGKTHLACGIAHEVIRRHRMTAIYSTITGAIRHFKDNWTTRTKTETEIINLFASPSLLILDEIGMGWGSDAELMYLFEIVNARYEAKRPTIFAGNIAREDVRKCLGDRVTDRLNEAGGRTLICKWDSARKAL